MFGSFLPDVAQSVPAGASKKQPEGGMGTDMAARQVNEPARTASGFVDHGPIVFRDVSRGSGLANWRHTGGDANARFILQSLGGGVALLDYDHDGWLDIYLVNSLTYEAVEGKVPPQHAALFHNNHDGTFTDVAARAGVTNDRWGVGVAVGDYDNDGWPDFYVQTLVRTGFTITIVMARLRTWPKGRELP